jgi:hypothetical protein
MIKNPFIRQLVNSCLDLAPIFAVILVFQLFIIRQPVPDVGSLITGTLFVILGLTLFIRGLEQSLFPIGESMAYAFARKGSVFWLMAFAFSLGFGAAIAEPGLTSVAEKAADIASNSHRIVDVDKANYALGLRITVAVSIGFAILVGVLRIIRGWPLHYPVFWGYVCIASMTPYAPAEIVGIAYDAGGIATSSITVPLVTVLGVGLATAIKGRNPLADGFGLVVFATLMATIFVLTYGIIL